MTVLILFPIDITLDNGGDLNARFVVKNKKNASHPFTIIKNVMNHMPEGELSVKIPRKIPTGEYGIVELREANYLFRRSIGTESPDRV
jgi:NADH-quinone oxidoreductase subunit D